MARTRKNLGQEMGKYMSVKRAMRWTNTTNEPFDHQISTFSEAPLPCFEEGALRVVGASVPAAAAATEGVGVVLVVLLVVVLLLKETWRWSSEETRVTS